jgi:hypothetical protein
MFVKINNENVSTDAIVSTKVKRVVLYAEDGSPDSAKDEVWFVVLVGLTNGRDLVHSRYPSEKEAAVALERFNAAVTHAARKD